MSSLLPRILFVEDDNERADAMMNLLGEHAEWYRAHTADEAITALGGAETLIKPGARRFDAVFLDYDLCPEGGGGDRVALFLRKIGYRGVLVVHSQNVRGAMKVSVLGMMAGAHVIQLPVWSNISPSQWLGVLDALREVMV